MKALSLNFEGFRNLQHGSLSACDGVNVIHGKNGQGKTNLLEAMWLFTGGRSFRGAKDAEMVALGGERAVLSMNFFSEEREQTARISIDNGRRGAELNGVKKRSATELVGTFCAVLFSPEHLSLVKDGPVLRRAFLDSALCQGKPAYASLLNRYARTLTQRNSLLKDIPRHRELLETLPIWDERLASGGEQIRKERLSYLEELKGPASVQYAGISGGSEALSLAYALSGEEALLDALKNARQEDVYTGHTSVGPHRDDLELFLGGVSARVYASQGQQRSIVLALKLAEAAVLEQKTGETPVVLLDDVLSELDAGRQNYLMSGLSGQVFLTCCEPGVSARLNGGKSFYMEHGNISEE